jgi:predicted RNA binding protein with dsRBD fold (UPF0201 family)
MTATQIRKQLRQYIDQVDEEYLTVLKVIIEDRLKVKEAGEIFFTPDEIEELERREKAFLSGEMSADSLDVVNKRVLSQIRKEKL